MKIYLILLCSVCSLSVISQNLILNPSFSETQKKADTSIRYRLLPEGQSEVNHWYLPTYINYAQEEEQYGFGYGCVKFFSSRDNYLLPKDREIHSDVTTNAEQVFKKNEGFVLIENRGKFHVVPILQQKISNPLRAGKYCLKFKYKCYNFGASNSRPSTLDFAISPTDLKEYYTGPSIKVPFEYIKVSYKDSFNISDENTPWQQRCRTIDLKGNEKFLSIGSFRYKDTYPWGAFYIDDIELYELEDLRKCDCESIQKDLSKEYTRKFPINKLMLVGDSLRMFSRLNSLGSRMITPEAEHLLREIIAFMQRDSKIKIRFIEYCFYSDSTPSEYLPYKHYLRFFGVSENRIVAKAIKCDSAEETYCSRWADFTRVGFLFYKDK